MEYRFKNGIYEGELDENGRLSGIGVFRSNSGNIYEGEFADGTYNGSGKLTYANGNVYEGGFANGLRQGEGVMSFAKGDVYEGDFYNDKFHGNGVYTFASGNFYEGTFENGKYNGVGRFVHKNGDEYIGEFIDNERSGFGRLTKTSGIFDVTYEGEFLHGVFHGSGKMSCQARDREDVYQGKWQHGQKHGTGRLVCGYSSGNVYEGGFILDKFEGYGEMRYSDGTVYVGEWRNGYKDGFGKITYSNGDSYEGEFKCGMYCGEGKETFPKRMTTFEGEFLDGMRHGFGQTTVNSSKPQVTREEWEYGELKSRVNILRNGNDAPKRTAEPSKFNLCFMEHCAFIIETPDVTLIFDCHVPDEIPYIKKDRPVAVFISHNHPDHYNQAIFDLADRYDNIVYYLGGKEFEKTAEKFGINGQVVMGGEKITTEWGEIMTLPSTDRGVAFVVTASERTFLHTGDMGMRYLSTEYETASRKKFYNNVAPLKNMHIDYGMLWMDSREHLSMQTAKAYLDMAAIDYFTPMHLWGDYSGIEEFLDSFPWFSKQLYFVHSSKTICKEISPMRFTPLRFDYY